MSGTGVTWKFSLNPKTPSLSEEKPTWEIRGRKGNTTYLDGVLAVYGWTSAYHYWRFSLQDRENARDLSGQMSSIGKYQVKYERQGSYLEEEGYRDVSPPVHFESRSASNRILQ